MPDENTSGATETTTDTSSETGSLTTSGTEETTSTEETTKDTTATSEESTTDSTEDDDKGGDDNKDDSETSNEVPEKYEAPEGMEIYNQELFDAFAAKAKEMGLSQKKFGEFAEMHAKAMEVAAQQQQDAFIDTRKQWVNEIQNDKELGGDKFQANLDAATNVLKTFDTDGSFAKVLDETGYGDNPAVFRFMTKVAAAISDDALIKSPKGPAETKPSDTNPMGYKSLEEYSDANITPKTLP